MELPMGWKKVGEACVDSIAMVELEGPHGFRVMWGSSVPVFGPLASASFIIPTPPPVRPNPLADCGLPHCLEHLCFMGTKERPVKFLDALANKMMATGTDAYTDSDHTSFYVSTVGGEGLVTLLPVFAEHIFHPTLSVEQFNTEIHHITGEGSHGGVVISELRGTENTPSRVGYRAIVNGVYGEDSVYASSSGGIVGAIRNTLKVEDVREYHAAHYRPGTVGLILTGEVDLNAALSSVTKILEDIPAMEDPVERPLRGANVGSKSITTSTTVEAKYPADVSEQTCAVSLAWMGPTANQPLLFLAITLLLSYLTENTSRTLVSGMVGSASPLAGEVDFQCYAHNPGAVLLYVDDVPVARRAEVTAKVLELLQKSSGEIDRASMKACISRRALLTRKMVRENPGEKLAEFLAVHHVHSPRDGEAHLNSPYPILSSGMDVEDVEGDISSCGSVSGGSGASSVGGGSLHPSDIWTQLWEEELMKFLPTDLVTIEHTAVHGSGEAAAAARLKLATSELWAFDRFLEVPVEFWSSLAQALVAAPVLSVITLPSTEEATRVAVEEKAVDAATKERLGEAGLKAAADSLAHSMEVTGRTAPAEYMASFPQPSPDKVPLVPHTRVFVERDGKASFGPMVVAEAEGMERELRVALGLPKDLPPPGSPRETIPGVKGGNHNVLISGVRSLISSVTVLSPISGIPLHLRPLLPLFFALITECPVSTDHYPAPIPEISSPGVVGNKAFLDDVSRSCVTYGIGLGTNTQRISPGFWSQHFSLFVRTQDIADLPRARKLLAAAVGGFIPSSAEIVSEARKLYSDALGMRQSGGGVVNGACRGRLFDKKTSVAMSCEPLIQVDYLSSLLSRVDPQLTKDKDAKTVEVEVTKIIADLEELRGHIMDPISNEEVVGDDSIYAWKQPFIHLILDPAQVAESFSLSDFITSPFFPPSLVSPMGVSPSLSLSSPSGRDISERWVSPTVEDGIRADINGGVLILGNPAHSRMPLVPGVEIRSVPQDDAAQLLCIWDPVSLKQGNYFSSVSGNPKDMAAVACGVVLMDYLSRQEGILWRACRGAGLCYGASIFCDPLSRGVRLDLDDVSGDPFVALETAVGVVSELLAPDYEWVSADIEQSKASAVFSVVSGEATATDSAASVLGYHIGGGFSKENKVSRTEDFHTRVMLRALATVTTEQLKVAAQELLGGLLSSETRFSAISLPPRMASFASTRNHPVLTDADIMDKPAVQALQALNSGK